MRVSPSEFSGLDLQAHDFLSDVPLADVSAVDLPGGPPGLHLADVRALMRSEDLLGANRVTRALFALRGWVGRRLGWDGQQGLPADSYVHRLTAIQRAASQVVPGTPDGPFHVVYALGDEMLTEIRNATVHAFLCATLVPASSGYRLYWGIYVKPVSRWTRLYMLAIEPFRRFIVYPSMLARVRRAWTAKYGRAVQGHPGG
jgi:hypothetical protein